MRNIIIFIKNNLKCQISYRISFFGSIILKILYYIFQFVFINQLLHFKNNIAGNNSIEFYLIYLNFAIIYLLIEFFSNSIHRFFEIVCLGEIEPHLVKPCSLTKTMLFRWCTPSSLIIAVVFLICIQIGINILNISVPLSNWLCYFSALVCLFLCNLSFIFGLNCLTFIINRQISVDYIHERIFDLSIIPISLYPNQILRWLILTLPIAVSSSLPVVILLDGKLYLLLYLLCATLILTISSYFLYRSTFKRFVGMGG